MSYFFRRATPRHHRRFARAGAPRIAIDNGEIPVFSTFVFATTTAFCKNRYIKPEGRIRPTDETCQANKQDGIFRTTGTIDICGEGGVSVLTDESSMMSETKVVAPQLLKGGTLTGSPFPCSPRIKSYFHAE